ncbi:Calumenin-A, partial [Trichinella patagoniensis]
LRFSMIGIFTLLSVYVRFVQADKGMREVEEHGARSPSERWQNSHYTDGKHSAHADHQVVLGSKKLAEEFDRLDADVAQSRLLTLAMTMDVDRDGFIDREELTHWIRGSLKKLEEEEAEMDFSQYDADADGFVSWDEYRKSVYGTFSVDEYENDTESMIHDDELIFKVADMNKDGKLNLTEYFVLVHPEFYPQLQKTLAVVTVETKDTDGDGLLTFEEYNGEMSLDDQDQYTLSRRARMGVADKDKDGKLNSDELYEFLSSEIDELVDEEVMHLFEIADMDHDSRLSMTEITSSYDTFVGSEATGYGELLEIMHEEL